MIMALRGKELEDQSAVLCVYVCACACVHVCMHVCMCMCVTMFEVGMLQLEMCNWISTYYSKGQELLLRHKCTIYVDLFCSVCHLTERYHLLGVPLSRPRSRGACMCVCLECTIWPLLHVLCHTCIVFKCHLLHSFCSFTSVIWLHGLCI